MKNYMKLNRELICFLPLFLFSLFGCDSKTDVNNLSGEALIYLKEAALVTNTYPIPSIINSIKTSNYSVTENKIKIPLTINRSGSQELETFSVYISQTNEVLNGTVKLSVNAYSLPQIVTVEQGTREKQIDLTLDVDSLRAHKDTHFSIILTLSNPTKYALDESLKTIKIDINTPELLKSDELYNLWKLVFEDNFDGSSVNTLNWGTYYSPGHAQNGIRRPEAFSVVNGNLVITAQMINGVLVSGGMAQRINYLYGRFEFRVRTEKDPSQTVSGVVLTWPQSEQWPLDGENDIYETGTKADRESIDTYIHYGDGIGTAFNKQAHFLHTVPAYEWHTFMMDWSAESLKIYRDGLKVWDLTDKKAIPQVAHHFCLQLDAFKQVMGDPVKMYVDWVRIYQQK